MKIFQQLFFDHMIYAQIIQKNYVNNSKTPFSSYKIKNEIFVDTKNLRFQIFFRKLDHKSYEIYKIIKLIKRYVCKLKFWFESNVHFVFHINKLRLTANDFLSNQQKNVHHFWKQTISLTNENEKWMKFWILKNQNKSSDFSILSNEKIIPFFDNHQKILLIAMKCWKIFTHDIRINQNNSLRRFSVQKKIISWYNLSL